MRSPTGPPSVRDWLGIATVADEWGGKERVEDYLLRHTRMIPRDVISLGNALSVEVLRHRKAGRDSALPSETTSRGIIRVCRSR